MKLEQSGTVEAVACGAIAEITNDVLARIDTAKIISDRVRMLRRRLVGLNDEVNDIEPSAPEPVRPDVERLHCTVGELREIFERTLNDLSQLESL